MGGLILRRLLTGLPTLLLVVALSFMLMRIAPGGPFDGERALDPATRAALASRYGLDKPLGEQFLSYIGGLLRGDFGPSMVYRDFRSEEHTSELQSLMRISSAVFCLKKKKTIH